MSSQQQDSGRPTYVRLTDDQREALEREAREEDRTVSYILRRLVEQHLDDQKAAA